MRLMLVVALGALAAGASPTRLLAQGSGIAPIAPTAAELTATAALRPAPTAPLGVTSSSLVADVGTARAGRGQGEILMIVGGAGIVTGLLVDESIVTIAGVAVAGYGLYLYLRANR